MNSSLERAVMAILFALMAVAVVLLAVMAYRWLSEREDDATRMTRSSREGARRRRPSLRDVASQVEHCESLYRQCRDSILRLQAEVKELQDAVAHLQPGVRPDERPPQRVVIPPRQWQASELGLSDQSSAAESQDLPLASPRVRLERLIGLYCARQKSMRLLVQAAKDQQLVWGAVNVNEMPPVFEAQREADVMAFGTPDTSEVLIVVGEECVFSEVRLSRFFGGFATDRPDQRVFATKPAVAVLTAGRRVEAKRSGVLEPSGPF